MLREDGILIPTTQFKSAEVAAPRSTEEPYKRARKYVVTHWKYCEPRFQEKDQTVPSHNLLERALSHFLCISGMAFQDAWNIDLERLRRCCIHVLVPDGKPVPFCSYYMTGTDGRRLQRNQFRGC